MDSNLSLMSMNELAEMLKISKPTLYALIRNNDLPSGYRIGRRCRVWTREEIEAWLLSKKGVAGNE